MKGKMIKEFKQICTGVVTSNAIQGCGSLLSTLCKVDTKKSTLGKLCFKAC